MPLSRNLGILTSWNPPGLSKPVMGLLYFFTELYPQLRQYSLLVKGCPVFSKGRCCNVVVLNVHAPSEEKSDGSRDSLYEDLMCG